MVNSNLFQCIIKISREFANISDKVKVQRMWAVDLVRGGVNHSSQCPKDVGFWPRKGRRQPQQVGRHLQQMGRQLYQDGKHQKGGSLRYMKAECLPQHVSLSSVGESSTLLYRTLTLVFGQLILKDKSPTSQDRYFSVLDPSV